MFIKGHSQSPSIESYADKYPQRLTVSQSYVHLGSDSNASVTSSAHLFPPQQSSDSATVAVMLGTHQDVTREALGHELALIGVPPPTTLDGFRPANGDEMKNFMISVGLSPDQGEEIAGKLKSSLTITSIVQFGWWFQEHSFKEWFHSHEEWRNNAPLFVAMTWALKTCDSVSHAKNNVRNN